MHKILAVDDEAHALKVLRLHLEEAGYKVFIATNGEEALALVDNHPDLDCILLDRMMPKMDGMKVLKRLKAMGSPHRHIPVILQTAKKAEQDIYDGINAKAVYYITKPFTREILLDRVKTVLGDIDAIKQAMNGE